jgi:hypothetical protein
MFLSDGGNSVSGTVACSGGGWKESRGTRQVELESSIAGRHC